MIQESGQWQFDLRLDEFADIKFQGQTVLRSVRAVIRDQDWNTADLVIDSVSETAEGVELAVHSSGFDAEFSGVISAKFEGTIATFTMEFTALSDYQTNRTGLIVLHSPELAGAHLEVIHSSGNAEALKFPTRISPNQPVFDIASLLWRHDALQIDVAFAGDVFEMEDQRNWSDASYKTYSRPLSKPFPYSVAAGEKILQIVKIQVASVGDAPVAIKQNKIGLTKVGKFPDIQVGAATAPDALPESWCTYGNPMNYKAITDVVLVELDLESSNWQAALQRAAESSAKLDVRLIVRDYKKLDAAIVEFESLEANKIVRIGAFDASVHISPQKLSDLLRSALQTSSLSELPIVVGARSHFTELNREQEQIRAAASSAGINAALTYASTPLFHSLTTEQLLESVAMQRIIAEQAVEIAAGLPVHVGPITLRPRFNNVATAAQPGPTKVDLSEGYGAEFTSTNDERQATAELAAWVIASAAATSVFGVASLSWFEQWGPRGLASESGQEYPAARAVRALAALAGQDLYIGVSPDGFVWAIGARDSAGKVTILASNLHQYPATVEISIEGQAHQVELEPLAWKQI